LAFHETLKRGVAKPSSKSEHMFNSFVLECTG
jgi:hypothetical protein